MARDLIVRIVGDERDYRRSLQKASKATSEFRRETDRTFRGVIAGSGAFRSLGRSAAFASASFLGGAGATAVMVSTVKAASDLNEELSKSTQVFGKNARVIADWSKTASESLKVSQVEALQFTSSIGAMLKTAGVVGPKLAGMSQRLVQLGADMASFNNQDPSEMLQRLQSGLAGEAEPLRRFGVLLSEARVQQEAYRTGLAKQGAKLTEQQKILARYSIILKDTADQQGDVARTGGQAAGQQREFAARVKDLQAALGTLLLPALVKVTTAMNNWLGKTENQKTLMTTFKAVIALVTPTVEALGLAISNLTRIVAILQPAIDKLGGGGGGGGAPSGKNKLAHWAFTAWKFTNPLVNLLRLESKALDLVAGSAEDAAKRTESLAKSVQRLVKGLSDIEAVRAGRFDKIAQKAAPPDLGANLAPFKLPFAIQQQEAKAATTQAKADDIAVAKQIKTFAQSVIDSVKPLVESGKFHGKKLAKLQQKLLDAYSALAGATSVLADAANESAQKAKDAADEQKRKAQEALRKQREAIQKIRDTFTAALGKARDELGALFEGPVLAPTDAQTRARLGFPGADITRLTQDIRAQTAQFKLFLSLLARIQKRGAGPELIKELRARGVAGIAELQAIANASGPQFKQFLKAFGGREGAAIQAATVTVRGASVKVVGPRDDRIVVHLNIDGETVTRVVTNRQQKKGRRQASQRRGAQTNVALA